MLDSGEQNRTLVPQIDLHARLKFQLVGKFRIHAGAGRGQGLKGCRSLKGAVNQHAARGVGGFTAGFSALYYQDGSSTFAQGDREREADDASADDDYVPGLHPGIVKEGGRERSWSWHGVHRPVGLHARSLPPPEERLRSG